MGGGEAVKQTGGRLAAPAAGVRAMGTMGRCRDGRAKRGQKLQQPGLDGLEVGLPEIAPADAGLVGDQMERRAGPGQPGQGFACAGDELHAVWIGQIVPVDNDRAVAVKEDMADGGRHQYMS